MLTIIYSALDAYYNFNYDAYGWIIFMDIVIIAGLPAFVEQVFNHIIEYKKVNRK